MKIVLLTGEPDAVNYACGIPIADNYDKHPRPPSRKIHVVHLHQLWSINDTRLSFLDQIKDGERHMLILRLGVYDAFGLFNPTTRKETLDYLFEMVKNRNWMEVVVLDTDINEVRDYIDEAFSAENSIYDISVVPPQYRFSGLVSYHKKALIR